MGKVVSTEDLKTARTTKHKSTYRQFPVGPLDVRGDLDPLSPEYGGDQDARWECGVQLESRQLLAVDPWDLYIRFTWYRTY